MRLQRRLFKAHPLVMEIANDHLARSATACGGLGQWLLDRSRHYLRDRGRRSRGGATQSRFLNSVSARSVPTWREVGRGPIRRDREDELDRVEVRLRAGGHETDLVRAGYSRDNRLGEFDAPAVVGEEGRALGNALLRGGGRLGVGVTHQHRARAEQESTYSLPLSSHTRPPRPSRVTTSPGKLPKVPPGRTRFAFSTRPSPKSFSVIALTIQPGLFEATQRVCRVRCPSPRTCGLWFRDRRPRSRRCRESARMRNR